MTESPTITLPHAPGWTGLLRSPWVLTLGALLLVQLVVALLLGSLSAGLVPTRSDAALLPMTTDTLTAIEISDATSTLKLDHTGDGWVLPELGNFPVSATRIEQLLTDLGALKRPLPIATTPAAHQRFKVADDAPERRLTLRGAAGAETKLLLGDSPGFRRVFARLAGEDGVFELRLGIADLPVRADDWIDRGKLRLERGRIERIAGTGWTLIKQGDTWTLEGQTDKPAPAAVDDLLNALSAISYSGVLGTEAKPGYGLDTPTLTLTIGLSGGEEQRYVIGQSADGPDAVLKADGQPWYYRLADYDLGALKGFNLDRLLGKEVTPAATGEVAAPDAAPADSPAVAQPPGAAGAVAEPAPTVAPTPPPEDAQAAEPAAEPAPSVAPAPPPTEAVGAVTEPAPSVAPVPAPAPEDAQAAEPAAEPAPTVTPAPPAEDAQAAPAPEPAPAAQ